MAGAPIKEETVLVRIKVPKRLYAYLRVLRLKSVVAASEPAIAGYLLAQRIEQMILDKYHEKIEFTDG